VSRGGTGQPARPGVGRGPAGRGPITGLGLSNRYCRHDQHQPGMVEAVGVVPGRHHLAPRPAPTRYGQYGQHLPGIAGSAGVVQPAGDTVATVAAIAGVGCGIAHLRGAAGLESARGQLAEGRSQARTCLDCWLAAARQLIRGLPCSSRHHSARHYLAADRQGLAHHQSRVPGLGSARSR